MSRYKRPSLETILTNTKEARSLGDWSMVWTTDDVPGMDNAFGGHASMRLYGRRKLRYRALIVGTLLTMHCRVISTALNGEFFLFLLFLILAVGGLANPMRHFEIYIGQWSINGPGRAFRIVPILDGIGMAICINAAVRSICCVCMASITGNYVMHAISDAQLPFTYCRSESLENYEPSIKTINVMVLRKARRRAVELENDLEKNVIINRNNSRSYHIKLEMCRVKHGNSTVTEFPPQYNFFYKELMHYRKGQYFKNFNKPLAIGMAIIWLLIWLGMITEHVFNGRLVWNNIHVGFIAVPWIWTAVIMVTACVHIFTSSQVITKNFNVNSRAFLSSVSDAVTIALYIHATSIGTSLIFGKGLNHYANGHIDPLLNEENVWFSFIVTLLTLINAGGSVLCSFVDTLYSSRRHLLFSVEDSTLWVLPMYSKCMLIGDYTHILSTVVFGGLMISYGVLAYIMMKAALHSIFEIRVKFVLREQIVVGILICFCMCLSMVFATNEGLALIELVDTINTNIALPFLCLMELITFMFAYRSHDFLSDMNHATEENMCSTRLDTQWKVLPFAVAICLVMRMVLLFSTTISMPVILTAFVPLACMISAIPIKACKNAYDLSKTETRPN